VETVGTTITFDEAGRRSDANERARGTRLVLRRRFAPEEIVVAKRLIRLCIPPKGTSLRLDGRLVRRPRAVLTFGSCHLETVVLVDGVERAAMGSTSLSIYAPRRGEEPCLFEMGLPVQAWNVPWHVDVAQRVPLGEGCDTVPER